MWVYRIEIRTKIYLALKMKVSNHKKIDLCVQYHVYHKKIDLCVFGCTELKSELRYIWR